MQKLSLVFPILCLATATSVVAQASWQLQFPDHSPPSRRWHAMTYDPDSERVMLYGGQGEDGNERNDLWAWDGNDWTELGPGIVTPPARELHAMCYDANLGRAIVVGGRSPSGLNPTGIWGWNGTQWSAVVGGQIGLTGREQPAMAFDEGLGRVVLFGGQLQNDTWPRDTWEWDGVAWTQRFPTHVPNIRIGQMAYDRERGVTVLYGRNNFSGNDISETWEWDGNDWTLVPTPLVPFAFGPIAYHDGRQRVVLFRNGSGETPLRTWEYDGVTWDLILDAPRPASFDNQLAYHSPTDALISYGGQNSTLTWAYVPRPVGSLTPFGSGCLGTGGIPQLALAPGQEPRLGASIAIEISSLPPTTTAFGLLGGSDSDYQGLPLPAPLGVIGMTGCSLLVSPEATVGVPTLGGIGVWLLAIPDRPELAGTEFFVQVLATDPIANPLGAIVSNGGAGFIGL